MSIGENTTEDMAETAKKMDLEGLGIVRYYNGKIEKLDKIEGIDIVNAIMIKADTVDELKKIAKKIREKAEILMVHGGNFEINRAACENSMIDILCHPELGRKDSGFDHVCAKAAAENNVAIEINFREILESFKKQRIHVLSSMKRNVMLCNKYNAKIITTSGAISKWGMRSGRDLAAIPNILGLELGDAISSVSEIPVNIVNTNREKLEGRKWVGFEIVK